MELYEKYVDPNLGVKRFNLAVNFVISEADAALLEQEEAAKKADSYEQLSLFDLTGSSGVSVDAVDAQPTEEALKKRLEKEKQLQLATIKIKEKYGRNAILKGTDYLDGATARERNAQIGGHKA